MKPEDIRKLYAAEDAATEDEARQTQQEVRTDPEAARNLIKVVYSMSVEDRAFAMLLRLFIEGTVMKMIEDRAREDDDFALHCGNLLADLMQATMRPVQRAGSGRHKKTRSA